MRKLVKQSWAPFCAGVAYGLSWEPYGIWPFALIGWAVWLGLGISGDRQAVFLKTLAFIVPAWSLAFFWIANHPIAVTAATSVLALLSYALVLAVLASSLVSAIPPERIEQRRLAALVAVILFEILISWGPFAMPWLSIGLSVAPSSWALVLSGWVGFKGVSAVILITAWLLASSVFAASSKFVSRGALFPAIGAALLFLAPFAGVRVQDDSGALAASDPLRVDILQPNWSPEDWSEVGDGSRVGAFASVLEMVSGTTDITVLPETALPLASVDSLRAMVARLSHITGSAVLAGGIEDALEGEARNIALSSVDEDRIHAKNRLVPFAESVPFSEWIPWFERFTVSSGGVSSYEPGTRSEPLQIQADSLQAVVMICFESLFARDARSGLRDGADVLVVLTQDGWWQSNAARRQHLAFSQMLAAATGHPAVHATVDGVSGLIDHRGQLVPLRDVVLPDPESLSGQATDALSTSPRDDRIYASVVMRGDLPMENRSTLFLRSGNRLFFSIFGALLFALLGSTINRLRTGNE